MRLRFDSTWLEASQCATIESGWENVRTTIDTVRPEPMPNDNDNDQLYWIYGYWDDP